MNLTEFLSSHIHSATAATAATAATTLSPALDWFSRVGQGVAVGLTVWIITHTISFFLARAKRKCQ